MTEHLKSCFFFTNWVLRLLIQRLSGENRASGKAWDMYTSPVMLRLFTKFPQFQKFMGKKWKHQHLNC